MRHESDG